MVLHAHHRLGESSNLRHEPQIVMPHKVDGMFAAPRPPFILEPFVTPRARVCVLSHVTIRTVIRQTFPQGRFDNYEN
jgi:hypothetical protein